MVTWENYEEYMIMHADGELNAGEEQALRAFIKEHKELEAEMAIYEQLQLVPDASEVFANKESLLKEAAAGRVVKLVAWRSYAVAAGILALICLAAIKWLLPEHQSNMTASAQRPAPNTATSPGKRKAEPATIALTAPQPGKAARTKQAPIKKPAMNNNNNLAMKLNPKRLMPTETDVVKPMSIMQTKGLESEIMPIAVSTIPVNRTLQTTAIAEENKTGGKKSLLDILNPSDDDRPRLETIKNVVASSVQGVRQIKKNIKESDISLKLGGREIAVINF